MNGFLTFLYRSYIKPHLDRQPKDDGDTFRFSLCEGNLAPSDRQDLEAVVAYAAVHAFLLGVRTGTGLRQNGAL